MDVMKKSALVLVTILLMVFSMMVTFHSVNALQSVDEGSTKITITLNESVDFWVDVKPSSIINWYCDDALVLINLSVAGFTKHSDPTKVTVIAAPISSPTTTQTPQPIVMRFYNDTHFAFNQKLWAFDGFHLVCSFNANANDYLQFNVGSTNSDPNRPNDVYSVSFKIESANYNTSYVSGTSFHQEVKLNYTDTFNLYVVKHPFSATVTVSGSIDLRRGDLATPTPTPSSKPTLQPTANTGPQVNYSMNPPVYVIGIIVIVIVSIARLLFYFKKHKKPNQFNPETLTKFSQEFCTRILLLQTHPTKDWWQ